MANDPAKARNCGALTLGIVDSACGTEQGYGRLRRWQV